MLLNCAVTDSHMFEIHKFYFSDCLKNISIFFATLFILLIYARSQQTFSVKDQQFNILGVFYQEAKLRIFKCFYEERESKFADFLLLRLKITYIIKG